jgi:hypothetical protein
VDRRRPHGGRHHRRPVLLVHACTSAPTGSVAPCGSCLPHAPPAVHAAPSRPPRLGKMTP